jgi:hypothetical protein
MVSTGMLCGKRKAREACESTNPFFGFRALLSSTGIERACTIRAVYFTHGDRLTRCEDGLSLGKAYLVSRMQALIQTRRIELPRTREAEELAEELLDYEIRVDEDANDKYGAFKVGTHDDLVTALGLAMLKDPRERRWVRAYSTKEPFNSKAWRRGL